MAQGWNHLRAGQFFGRVAGRRTTGGVTLSEVVHPGARVCPRHAHERTYLSLVLAGSYAEQIGPQALDHRPMTAHVRPGGVVHRDRVGPRGSRFFIMEMDAAWLDGVAGSLPALGDPAALGTEPLWVLLRLYRELRRWDHCSGPVAEALAAELVGATQSRSGDRHAPPWLGRVTELVRSGFRRTVPLAELAREAGVHPAHASRTFRRFVGRSPAEWARELRVRWVCERLGDRERPLSHLAYEAGFADQAHMTRMFRRYVGESPGRLRAAMAG
jgi:AraC family transcriptional regulator